MTPKRSRPTCRPRLVALDLDGTTLNPQHTLSPHTRQVIRRVADSGVRVVLASGRLPHSILAFVRELGLDGTHIGLNGAVAFDHNHRLLHAHGLSLEQLTWAHEAAEAAGLPAMVFGAGGLWSRAVTPEVEFVVSFGEPPPRLYRRDALAAIEAPMKVLMVAPDPGVDPAVAASVAGRLDTVRTGPTFLEFMAPGVSKGAALTELLADLGLDRSEVLAIGDSENDLSLLAAAGFGVAMGNATEAVRRAADVQTLGNDADGCARALEAFVLDFDGQ